jgi:hypothetical protein
MIISRDAYSVGLLTPKSAFINLSLHTVTWIIEIGLARCNKLFVFST